ncbi:MAG: hypothetical protein IT292_09485 [Deltaproteobacteria bacterium]|nr:hypothetical protein [Deltaproteobacteria bacterium]
MPNIPQGAVVLTDAAGLHGDLAMHKNLAKDIRIVSIFSPEVRFLFLPEITFEEAALGLKQKGIRYVLISQDNNLNFVYLRNFRFFRQFRFYSKNITGQLYQLPE